MKKITLLLLSVASIVLGAFCVAIGVTYFIFGREVFFNEFLNTENVWICALAFTACGATSIIIPLYHALSGLFSIEALDISEQSKFMDAPSHNHDYHL